MRRLYGMTCASITLMHIDGSIDYESAERLYKDIPHTRSTHE
jgi:dihydrodipicolinate synthase/N-acetylneuraminate lyase